MLGRLACSPAGVLASGCTPVGGPLRCRLGGRPKLLVDARDRVLQIRVSQQAERPHGHGGGCADHLALWREAPTNGPECEGA